MQTEKKTGPFFASAFIPDPKTQPIV